MQTSTQELIGQRQAMESRPCMTCVYFSQHWLGNSFPIDDRCSNPKLVYYTSRIVRKVDCKVMRKNENWCGKTGKFWEPSVS